jgi:hypothetical protein
VQKFEIAVLLALFGLLGAGGCRGACDRLVDRYCECDLSIVENKRGCDMARDRDRERAAREKARKRGKDLEQICREKLETFDCPDRALPEFYPGGFSYYE